VKARQISKVRWTWGLALVTVKIGDSERTRRLYRIHNGCSRAVNSSAEDWAVLQTWAASKR
jgi:hypothetical protein